MCSRPGGFSSFPSVFVVLVPVGWRGRCVGFWLEQVEEMRFFSRCRHPTLEVPATSAGLGVCSSAGEEGTAARGQFSLRRQHSRLKNGDGGSHQRPCLGQSSLCRPSECYFLPYLMASRRGCCSVCSHAMQRQEQVLATHSFPDLRAEEHCRASCAGTSSTREGAVVRNHGEPLTSQGQETVSSELCFGVRPAAARHQR